MCNTSGKKTFRHQASFASIWGASLTWADTIHLIALSDSLPASL